MTDEWHIELDQFATQAKVLTGTFAPGDLPRLRELVAAPEGELNYTVSAGLDKQRRKVVSCIIKGFAHLTCQATLETFRHEIEIDDRLVLVDDESSLPAFETEGEEEDFMVAEDPLDLRDLVEDAVILALPMVPRKPGLEEAPVKIRDAEPKKESPFAVLSAVKRPDKR